MGIVWSIVTAWYTVLVFTPISNYFAGGLR